MAKANGCEYGWATRWVVGILVSLALLAAMVGIGAAGMARTDIRENDRRISALREALARIEERQDAAAQILERMERKLFAE